MGFGDEPGECDSPRHLRPSPGHLDKFLFLADITPLSMKTTHYCTIGIFLAFKGPK